MKLATVALSSALALSLGICSKPSAHAEVHVKEDGVHVRVYLDGVDEVEIAGRTLGNDETVVVPFSEFGVGLNEIPITGKGLDNVVTHVDLSPDKVLQFNCGEEKRKASIEVVTADGKPPTPNKWREFGCDVVGGKLVAPVKLSDGFALEVEGGELADGTLRVDLRPALWAMPVPKGGVARVRLEGSEHAISLKSPSGKVWTGKLIIKNEGDTLGSLLSELPEAGQGMPEAGKLAAMRVGQWWNFEGDGQTLGEIDLWVYAAERAEPVAMTNCNFQELGLGNAVHSLKINGITETYVAVDRQGNELGRKEFTPKGCPTSVTIEPDQTELEVVVASEVVREWVVGLRGKG